MTLAGGMPATPAGLVPVRAEPKRGEIGCVGACPLCAPGYPPCLACRDTLRARLRAFQLDTPLSAAAVWN